MADDEEYKPAQGKETRTLFWASALRVGVVLEAVMVEGDHAILLDEYAAREEGRLVTVAGNRVLV